MGRSPIEAMIDAACECVKCGKAGAIGTCGCWIILECPKCHRRQIVDRDESDPPRAARICIQCPSCDHGDRDTPSYFAADGSEVSWTEAA